jgi:23S rRNA pseudouridine955/2504/2580 synthase
MKEARGPKIKGVAVLFEDDEVLALDKASGLAVQGGSGVGVSLDILLARVRSPAPLLLHRLDRDTSGVILAAKTRESAAKYSVLLRGMNKRYTALCAGSAPERGRISSPLSVRGKTLSAETAFRRTESGVLCGLPCSLLEIKPGTGRMHQIRRHLAGLGFPILGDDKYGDFSLNKTLRKSAGIKRLLLHAASLTLPGGLVLCAPLPEHFRLALEAAGISVNPEDDCQTNKAFLPCGDRG